MSKPTLKTFEPGTTCIRCGIDRSDKPVGHCSAWGESWRRHLWNDTKFTATVHRIKETSYVNLL